MSKTMQQTTWVLIDTETNGLQAPIMVVEIGAQKMQGWMPIGPPFRRLLNQNTDIPPEASRIHGYTREILERDGEPAKDVYRDFAAYVSGLPIVAFNLEFDLEKVLQPEWKRLGIQPIGSAGFCALRLAQRLLDPVPAGNCKLQTLRQYYRLPERGAHTALGDVETVADLLAVVLRPIAESRDLNSWADVCSYTVAEWFPSRIAFGKFKGRHYQEARQDQALLSWLKWLARSTNTRTAKMGEWYLSRINCSDLEASALQVSTPSLSGANTPQYDDLSITPGAGVVLYANPDIEHFQHLIAAARTRLAGLEATYTQERHAVDVTRSIVFGFLREHFKARDRLRLVIEYRRKYLTILVLDGEDEAKETAAEYEQAKAQSDSNYDEAASAASTQKVLSFDEENEIKALWKKLVRLYHPDRFADQPQKQKAYLQLTSAINHARDSGNIKLLREIANDPQGFILRQGWGGLSFDDTVDIEKLRRLFESLQIEIMKTIELLNDLHESEDFTLHQLGAKEPELLKEVAGVQVAAIDAEVELLEVEAARLASEIAELTGVAEQAMND